MTTAARLDFVTVFCGALHDAADLLRVLWKGNRNWSDWTVQVVKLWHSQLGQGVALENHEAWVVSDCREEAFVAGNTLSVTHFERTARSLEGVVVVPRLGFSTGRGERRRVDMRKEGGWKPQKKARPLECAQTAVALNSF